MAKQEKKTEEDRAKEELDPATLTVQEIKDLVDSGELDEEQLEQLKTAEEASKGRKTVLDSIDAALATGDDAPSAPNGDAAESQSGAGAASAEGSSEATSATSTEGERAGPGANDAQPEASAETVAPVDLEQVSSGADAIAAGQSSMTRGEHEAARAYFRKARELYEAAGDSAGVARSIEEQGTLALLQADYGGALGQYEEALGQYQAQGNRQAQIDVLRQLGLVHKMSGNTVQMRACYREAETLATHAGEASAEE